MSRADANPKVDALMLRQKSWRAEFEELRRILLVKQFSEDFKWVWPCYGIDDKNVVLMHGFKEYCALLFFNGALLADKKGVLIQQTENVQARRQMRFTSVDEIKALEKTIVAYVKEAAANEQAGKQYAYKPTTDFAMAEEFLVQLEEMPGLREAFEALTPGRQRGYLLRFSGAKKSETRAARVAEAIPRIMAGLGLDD
jgi:uncharacterized protein YdeI (YjbR/CyaY-like superfamily)